MKQLILVLALICSVVGASIAQAGPKDPSGKPPPPPVEISDATPCDSPIGLQEAGIEQTLCRTATNVKRVITGSSATDSEYSFVDQSCAFVTNITWLAINPDVDHSAIQPEDYAAYFMCADDQTQLVILPDGAIFEMEETVLINLAIRDRWETYMLPLYGLTADQFAAALAEVFTANNARNA